MRGRVFHATDALKKKEVVCLVVRAAGRISCLGFLWDRGLREEAKGGRQFVSGLLLKVEKAMEQAQTCDFTPPAE